MAQEELIKTSINEYRQADAERRPILGESLRRLVYSESGHMESGLTLLRTEVLQHIDDFLQHGPDTSSNLPPAVQLLQTLQPYSELATTLFSGWVESQFLHDAAPLSGTYTLLRESIFDPHIIAPLGRDDGVDDSTFNSAIERMATVYAVAQHLKLPETFLKEKRGLSRRSSLENRSYDADFFLGQVFHRYHPQPQVWEILNTTLESIGEPYPPNLMKSLAKQMNWSFVISPGAGEGTRFVWEDRYLELANLGENFIVKAGKAFLENYKADRVHPFLKRYIKQVITSGLPAPYFDWEVDHRTREQQLSQLVFLMDHFKYLGLPATEIIGFVIADTEISGDALTELMPYLQKNEGLREGLKTITTRSLLLLPQE